MYTPQTEPIEKKPAPESHLEYPLMRACRAALPFFGRALRFRKVTLLHPERLVEAYRDFTSKKQRLIVAFRHGYGDDPQLMILVMHRALPKAARRLGKPIGSFTHAHFIHGVEVPMWSGKAIGWLLPRVGAVPVDHTRMDSKGLNRIRKCVSEGPFPTALAPEGHVTYGSERIVELETGTARFGFWCAEDLAKKGGETTEVASLPLSTHYRYGRGIERKLSVFIAAMETECGIEPPKRPGAAEYRSLSSIASRLRSLGASILDHLSALYAEIGREPVPAGRDALLEASLRAAERILCLTPEEGDKPMARLYRIRSAGWDRIFRDDLSRMTPLRAVMAGRETAEAWYAMRHMETVEMLTYVDLSSVADGLSANRYVEIANNFYDVIERIKGGTLKNRANAFDKYAVVVPAEPIMIGDYLDLWKSDRKAALEKVTDDMRTRFDSCVDEYRREYP
jgi:hypothetical protein